jgi:hypothetical protein
MPKKSEYLCDQENWIRMNCFLQARAGHPVGTPVDKVLDDARKILGFVLGGGAEVISIDAPDFVPSFGYNPQEA